jgi:RNA polymerase sigma factor (sigma-70 family)
LTKVERIELSGILRKAIDALPCDQRQTLIMVEYLHMPYKEVAEVLDVTVSAVKMRIKRARESLRVGLQILGADGSDIV